MFNDDNYDRLGGNCVILASSTDINTDAGYTILYELGDGLKTKSLYSEELYYGLDKPLDWMKRARIQLTPKIKRFLFNFDGAFESIRTDSVILRLPGDDQKRGRLFITVKNSSLWKNVFDSDFGELVQFFPQKPESLFHSLTTESVIVENMKVPYGYDNKGVLYKIAITLKKKLGAKDCVILGDCADADVSPVYCVIYSVDGTLKTHEIDADMGKVDISDIDKWLESAKVKIELDQIKYMSGFPSERFSKYKTLIDKAENQEQEKQQEKRN